jgi:hypothetical protein
MWNITMVAEYRWIAAECRWTVAECMQMTATNSYRRDLERMLIVQNIFRGDIGSAELCRRYHRHHGTMLEAT